MSFEIEKLDSEIRKKLVIKAPKTISGMRIWREGNQANILYFFEEDFKLTHKKLDLSKKSSHKRLKDSYKLADNMLKVNNKFEDIFTWLDHFKNDEQILYKKNQKRLAHLIKTKCFDKDAKNNTNDTKINDKKDQLNLEKNQEQNEFCGDITFEDINKNKLHEGNNQISFFDKNLGNEDKSILNQFASISTKNIENDTQQFQKKTILSVSAPIFDNLLHQMIFENQLKQDPNSKKEKVSSLDQDKYNKTLNKLQQTILELKNKNKALKNTISKYLNQNK